MLSSAESMEVLQMGDSYIVRPFYVCTGLRSGLVVTRGFQSIAAAKEAIAKAFMMVTVCRVLPVTGKQHRYLIKDWIGDISA